MPVLAATELASAHVEIVPAIDISEQNQIDFGTLSNIDGICTMSAGGTLSGSAGMDCSGAQTPGLFTISGLDGATVNISVSQGNSGGITFIPTLLGGGNRSLDGGSINVTVLGSLELNNASEGEKDISYTLTANYE